ncbi:MAG: hypothetical protein EOP88_00470 [Verrucomicrobiaceae bacterium]|nr:MAG: hypothetical protein EOP88_00470 [Verrucomicrobiaceae bacterium]
MNHHSLAPLLWLLQISRAGAMPLITTPPAGGSVPAHTTISLGVEATGAATYQWRKNGEDLPGRTEPTLVIPSCVFTDTGVYAVRVSDGTDSTTSLPTTVTVVDNVAWAEDFATDPLSRGWQLTQFLNAGSFGWDLDFRAVTFSHFSPNDSAIHKTVTGLLPNHSYRFHGWVKGAGISPPETGANLCQWNTWTNKSAAEATFDWKHLSVMVVTDASGSVDVACRLGFWGSTASGTASFSNLALEEALVVGNPPRPMVRVAYLIPSNRSPQPGGVSKLQRTLPIWQAWYREQMELNGFGPKTFEFETGEDGITPLIHVVNIEETDADIRGSGGYDQYSRASAAAINAGIPVGGAKQVWLLIAEAHVMLAERSILGGVFLGGGGGSGDEGGTAVVDSTALARLDPDLLTDTSTYDGAEWPDIGPYPLKGSTTFVWFEGSTFSSICSAAQGGTLHELSHAFGLSHDYRNDDNFNGNLMFNGCRGIRGNFHPSLFTSDHTRLSHAAALVLNTSRYFNSDVTYTDQTRPTVTVGNPLAEITADGRLRIHFSAADDTGLASALLHFDTGQDVVGETPLSGNSTDESFVTTYFHPGQSDSFGITVYDTSGNRTYVAFNTSNGGVAEPAARVKIAITPPAAAINEPVLLSAFGTTAAGSGLQVQWDLDGNGTFETPLSSNLALTASFPNAGIFLIRAKATTSGGTVSESAPMELRVYQPSLKIEMTGGSAHLTWPVYMANFRLQFSDTLNGSDWYPMEGTTDLPSLLQKAASPTEGVPRRFFRLFRP